MNTPTRALLGSSLALGVLTLAPRAHAMPSYITSTGSWSQGNPPAALADTADHFCYLTSVTGHFVGTGEWVRVWGAPTSTGGNTFTGESPPGSNWWVGGGSEQQSVAATANCMPYSTFKAEPGLLSVDDWTATIAENTGPTGQTGSCPKLFLVISEPCFSIQYTASGTAWQGDAAVTVSGMTGQFLGGGEYLEADQATSPFMFNTFTADAESYNGIGGWAQGLFVGVPQSGFNPSFFGPNATGPASAANAGTFSASAASGNFQSGTQTVNMALTSKAVCYISKIGGAFAGSGESVSIGTAETDAGEVWTLTVNSQQGNGTFAEARCYGLDQSTSL